MGISRRRLLIAGGTTALVAACGGAAPAPAAPAAATQGTAASGAKGIDALVAAARKDASFVSWGPDDPGDVKCYMDSFSKAFPGVANSHFEITAGEASEKIVTEAKAGRTSLDVGMASLDTAQPLLDRDLVASFGDWDELFKLPKGAVNDKGRLLAFYHLSHPVGINTKALGSLPAPSSWEALLDPIYKGKLIVEVRGKPFGMLGTVWGEKKLTDYVTALRAQSPRILKGGTTVTESLAAGEAPLAIGAYGYKIAEYADKKGAPLTYAKFGPMSASSFQLYVLKGAAHPSAGRLFAGWLASPDGQKTLEACTGKGSLVPGSGGKLAQMYQQDGVQLIFESTENVEAGGKFEAIAAKILGSK